MSKPKTPAPVTNRAPVEAQNEELLGRAMAKTVMRPDVSAAMVIHTYMGKSVSLNGLMDGLTASMDRSRGGDLATLEAMLVGQATALQAIFTKLAVDAQAQSLQCNMAALLGLALKAQAQSRATITALVDLKHPRQALFVKQANIASGNQQVNNAMSPEPGFSACARAHEEIKSSEIKVLEVDDGKFGKRMDTGTTSTPTRGHPAMEALETVNRPDKRKRKGSRIA